MKFYLPILIVTVALAWTGSTTELSAQSAMDKPVIPSKPDKEQMEKAPSSSDTTTPSPVEPTRNEKPASEVTPKKPESPNRGESSPAPVTPSKPGAADQAK